MSGHRRLNHASTSKQSNNDPQLAGYYLDQKTGRYYREPPIGFPITPCSPSMCRENSVNEYITQPKDRSLSHVPDFLMKRQIGISNDAFGKKFLKLKTMNLKLSETIDLTTLYTPMFEEIALVKGASRSLLLQYKLNRGGLHSSKESSVTEMHHRYTPDSMKGNQFRVHKVSDQTSINDICMGFGNNECIIFVGNSFRDRMGMTQIMWRPTGSVGVERVLRSYTCVCPIWCCSSNNFTEKFALGLQDAFSINSENGNLYLRNLNGNVHGINFNESGNLVYCALNNGNVLITDLRALYTVANKKIDKIGLDEVVLTSNENYLIIGGFDGFLCKVDLRNYRQVLEYHGHVHTPLKTPFSISEPHNILCATGSDNVTRLWSLNDGGLPLNVVPPPSQGSVVRSCLITDGSRVGLFMSHKKEAMIYDIF